MTSATSRRSFYPLPPSAYPQPLIDPDPAFATTYSHHHCAHTVKDENFFRTRTLNERCATMRALTAAGANGASPSNPLATASQGLYPRHGTGQFVLPYYRRDSKGFRVTYQQPEHVDDLHTSRADLQPLVQSGFRLAHPTSRPTYAAAKSSVGQGATFVTSYRNSGLYDSINAAHTNRVTRQVAEKIQAHKTQQAEAQAHAEYEASINAQRQLSGLGSTQPLPSLASPSSRPASAYPSSRPLQRSSLVRPQSAAASSAPAEEFGYYTGEVRDTPPPGAEIEVEAPAASYASDAASVEDTQRALAGDPMLDNALDNAFRKARTTYKRSYGYCF